MANVIEILIKANNKASAELAKVDKSLMGVGKAAGASSGGIGKLGSTLDTTLRSLTGFGLSAFTTIGAITQLIGITKQIINETVEYGKQVDDLSRALGTNTEEASKLIQIADDLRIDVGSLTTAFRIALRQGVLPTIDGLKEMAIQYQALISPQEKAQFALKTFGRSGLQMQKILELDAAAINEMAKSAERAGLVMSREGVDATKKYWKELDNLSDTWQGLKIQMGQEIIPALGGVFGWINRNLAAENLLNDAYKKGIITRFQYRRALEEVRFGIITLAEAEKFVESETQKTNKAFASSASHWLPAMEAATISAAKSTEELAEDQAHLEEMLAKSGQSFSDLAEYERFQGEMALRAADRTDKHSDSLKDAADSADEFREKSRELNRAQENLLGSLQEIAQQNIADFFAVDIDPAGIAKQLFDVVAFKEAGGEAMNTLIGQVQAAVVEGKITPEQAKEFFKNIAIEGQALEVQLGKISLADAAENISEDFNIPIGDAKILIEDVLAGIDLVNNADLSVITEQFDALEARKALLIEAGEIPIEADPGDMAEKKLDTLKDKLDKLTQDVWNIDVALNILGGGKQPKPPGSSNGPGGQHGLDIIVPSGFPGDTYPVRASSGERVTITPAGSSYSYGGDTINIYNNNAAAAVLTKAMVADRKRARLNASMGR